MAAVSKADLVIVGGGLSGLALAYYLQDKLKVVLLESSERLGGVVCTKHKQSYLLEYGPNTTRTTSELEELLNSLELGEHVVTASAASKKRYLVSKNRKIVAAPGSLLGAIQTPLLSASEKLRILKEPFIKSQNRHSESVETFISRRFGKGVSQKLVAAILSGIWAGDISQMEATSTLPSLVAMETEFGSVIKGLMHKKKSSHKQKIISFDAGMNTLIDGLACKLRKTAVLTNAQVHKLELGSDSVAIGFNDQTVEASRVVLTHGTDAVSKLIAPIDSTIAQQLSSIPYSPLGIVHLAFKRTTVQQPVDGFGFLVPPIYGDGLLGCIFNSAIFPNRAPDDEILLTAFVGGATVPNKADVNQEANRLAAIASVKRLLKINAEPVFVEATYLPRAIPNYNIGHHNILHALETLCKKIKLVDILGNWQRQISVAERITAAKFMAQKLLG